MSAIPIPPPYKGERYDLPLAALENPYAEIVKNYNLDNGIPTIRNGDLIWSYGGADDEITLGIATHGASSAQELFTCYDDSVLGITWLDVSTAGVQTTVHSAGGTGGDDEIVTLFFNNYLFWFGETSLLPAAQGPQYYNGSAWGAAAYTWPSGLTQPFGGGVYKNRAYIIQRQSSKYAYSEINAISGAMTEVDLSQIISESGYLYGIRSVALSEGLQQETVCAFIFSSGEILVYSGSYPNSANWSLVGRFIISEPLSYHSFLDARGDTFIITDAGLISLRSLFTQGADLALIQAISAPIANRWQQVIFNQGSGNGGGSFRFYARGEYDHLNDRIVISFPNYVNYDGENDYTESMRLVYSFKVGAWYEQVMTMEDTGFFVSCITYYNNGLYFGGVSRNVKLVEGKGNPTFGASQVFLDDSGNGSADTPINYQLRTMPLPLGKFAVNQLQGVELISKTDLHAETNYKLIGNFGQAETLDQKLPSQGNFIAKPIVNVGIESDYVQLDISGATTSSTAIGQQIYALNIWNQPGVGPR